MTFNFEPAKFGNRVVTKQHTKTSIVFEYGDDFEQDNKHYHYLVTFSSVLENNVLTDNNTLVSKEKHKTIILMMQMGRNYDTIINLLIENKNGVTYADINTAMKKHLEMNVKELSVADRKALESGNAEWNYPLVNNKPMIDQYLAFLFVEGFCFCGFRDSIPRIGLLVGS